MLCVSYFDGNDFSLFHSFPSRYAQRSVLRIDVDQGMMEKKYYPIAYVLIILSSVSAQSMNVSAVGLE